MINFILSYIVRCSLILFLWSLRLLSEETSDLQTQMPTFCTYKHCWSDHSVKMLQHQLSVTDTIFALFICIMQNPKIFSWIFLKHNFLLHPLCLWDLANQQQLRPSKAGAWIWLKLLASRVCSHSSVLEEQRSYETMKNWDTVSVTGKSPLLAFKPTIQKKVEIHNFSSGSLHNGNHILPFWMSSHYSVFPIIYILSDRLAERLHNLGYVGEKSPPDAQPWFHLQKGLV